MGKREMKRRLAAEQGGECALTGESLATDQSLNDTDRELPKVEGGIYTDENTRVVEPVAHQKRHGHYRPRDPEFESLKTLFDDRAQTMKLALKIGNQLKAYDRRVDHKEPEVEAFLQETLVPVEKRLGKITRVIEKAVKAMDDPLINAAFKVLGLGPVTIGALTVYVDLERRACLLCKRDIYRCEAIRAMPAKDRRKDEKVCAGNGETIDGCSSPSALWAYVGLDKPSYERHVKGKEGGGNKTLRTILWNAANVMMKLRVSGYRPIYDRIKGRLEISEKIVVSRNTQGNKVEVAWKDTKPSHRHGAALRVVMKHILVDYWLVGRELKGLPTRTIYAEAMLGHTHIETPADHGWPAINK